MSSRGYSFLFNLLPEFVWGRSVSDKGNTIDTRYTLVHTRYPRFVALVEKKRDLQKRKMNEKDSEKNEKYFSFDYLDIYISKINLLDKQDKKGKPINSSFLNSVMIEAGKDYRKLREIERIKKATL